MRIVGAKRKHFAGWAGGVWEDSEPDLSEDSAVGVLQEAMNTIATPGGRRAVRNGTRVVQTFSAVSGDDISDVVGIFRWSQTGAIAIAHSADAEKHFAYALDTDAQFALPVGSITESGSRVDAGWDSTTPGRPLGVELFETLYVVDSTLPSGNRQPMIALKLDTGALVASTPTYDLDNSGGSPGAIYPVCAAVYNGVLFVAGYDSETGGFQPHLLRHSWLGRNPAAADGFHYLAYAVIGALNEPIMALSPGSSLLLVAKENELYRVSGQGKGIEGWQYAIAQVDNSLGFGCSNPYAVAHVNGLWYGVGAGGPWQSDGASVRSLLPGRNRSWAAIDNLALAFVRPHPDRRRIVFGFHRVGEAGYPEAPYRFWLWDIERQRWDSDWQSGTTRSYHVVEPIPGSVVVPDASPVGLAQSFDDGEWMPHIDLSAAAIFRHVWGTFVPGDLSAETEVWVVYNPGDSYSLVETLPAGVGRFRIIAPVSSMPRRHGPYTVRVRHKKAGGFSNYTPEVLFYPPLVPPSFFATYENSVQNQNGVWVWGSLGEDDVDVHGESEAGGYSDQWSAAEIAAQSGFILPHFIGTPTPGNDTEYRFWAYRSDWPAGQQESLRSLSVAGTDFSKPPAPRQHWQVSFGRVPYVQWHARQRLAEHKLQIRLFGSSDPWVTIATHTTGAFPEFNGSNLSPVGSFGDFLPAGTKYEMRVVFTDLLFGTDKSSDVVPLYTPLPSPTITSLVATGSPEVTITVDVPMAGHDVRIWNADKSYDATEAGASAGALVKVSGAGVCGLPGRYYVRLYNSEWPEGYQYSEPAVATIASPCT